MALLSFDQRRVSRGFTLTEIMVVIFIIAILAVVASPAFIKVMRDSGLNRMTMEIAGIYRTAYLESAAQSTCLVRWKGGATPSIELVRATLDTSQPTLVSPRGCNAIDWTDPAHTHDLRPFNTTTIPNYATVGYLSNNNTEKNVADVCYSQRRAFVRFDNGVFTEMPGAGRVYVKNMQTNIMRRVLIPPFGLPRLIQ